MSLIDTATSLASSTLTSYAGTAKAVLVVAVASGLVAGSGALTDKYVSAGYEKQIANLKAADAVSLAKTQTAALAASEHARTLEAQLTTAMAKINESTKENLNDEDKHRAAAVATSKLLAGGMYVSTVKTGGAHPGGSGNQPEAAASAPGSDGISKARLSDEAAEFFITFASDADKVVDRLTSCQEVIRKYLAVSGQESAAREASVNPVPDSAQSNIE